MHRSETMYSLGQMLDKLPPRETCDELLEAFVATVYPLIPVLHLPSFYRQWDRF